MTLEQLDFGCRDRAYYPLHLHVSFFLACYYVNRFVVSSFSASVCSCIHILLCYIYFDGSEKKKHYSTTTKHKLELATADPKATEIDIGNCRQQEVEHTGLCTHNIYSSTLLFLWRVLERETANTFIAFSRQFDRLNFHYTRSITYANACNQWHDQSSLLSAWATQLQETYQRWRAVSYTASDETGPKTQTLSGVFNLCGYANQFGC